MKCGFSNRSIDSTTCVPKKNRLDVEEYGVVHSSCCPPNDIYSVIRGIRTSMLSLIFVCDIPFRCITHRKNNIMILFIFLDLLRFDYYLCSC